MSKIQTVAEGLILVLLGAYMLALVGIGDYWRFLNPKFMWLTGLTACGLLLAGGCAFYFRKHQLSKWTLLVYLILFCLVAVANQETFSGSSKWISAAGKTGNSTIEDLDRYVKINTGELFLLGKRKIPEELAGSYRTRGFIRRTSELDEIGQFLLFRVRMICCLADAISIGFRVHHEDVKSFKDRQWIEVFGSLTPSPLTVPAEDLKLDRMAPIYLNKEYIIQAKHLEKIDPPVPPFMFEFKEKPPFGY